MQESIISGLISGITVTFLVVFARNFWISVITPWFEERVYKDAKIEGKWFGLYPTSLDLRQDVITLKRHGHSIKGTMTCTKSKGGDEGDEYNVCGSFRNMLLPLTYESTDKKKTDRGSMTLACVRNGQRFKGKIALYNTIEDEISEAAILWFRSKEDLEKVVVKINSHKEELKRIREEKTKLAQKEDEIETIDSDDISNTLDESSSSS
jgi:hypothetical protein